jgi:hypothetical protein
MKGTDGSSNPLWWLTKTYDTNLLATPSITPTMVKWISVKSQWKEINAEDNDQMTHTMIQESGHT